METRCPACSTLIRPGARFCPRCGAAVPSGVTAPVVAPNAHPPTAPIPRAGKIVFLSLLVGIALVVVGLVTGNYRLVFIGAGIVGVLAFILITGDIFS
jgi:hypothetical protein